MSPTLVVPTKIRTRFNLSQRIIALGIVLAFFYWAGSVVITILTAALLAYFLDTIVVFLERLRLHRAVGALLVLLVATGVLAGMTYMMIDRADQFLANWPVYNAQLQRIAAPIDRKVALLESQIAQFTPQTTAQDSAVRVTETTSTTVTLLQGAGSVFSFFLIATFLPFLVFFMLAAKPLIWNSVMEFFPQSERAQVRTALDEVGLVLRRYVAGNALIGLILVTASWIVFRLMGLNYAFLVAGVAGLLNLIPYLGALLALLPPFFIGLAQWTSITPYLIVGAIIVGLHIIAMNALIPAIVGRRVHLNGLAVTLALFFWGWLWGAMGLILAIPITAVMKVVCDHVEGWQPAGRLLGG